jgi:hypothetical protein
VQAVETIKLYSICEDTSIHIDSVLKTGLGESIDSEFRKYSLPRDFTVIPNLNATQRDGRRGNLLLRLLQPTLARALVFSCPDSRLYSL